jgi:hypothetical protein
MPSSPTAIELTHPTAGLGGAALTIELPHDLLWSDQYSWSKLLSVKKYLSTGALHVDQWSKNSGRPMTLQGTQERAWCERGQLAQLRLWADQTDLVLSMNFRGDVYPVMFDTTQEPGAITADPITDVMQGGISRYTVRNELAQIVTDVSLDYFDPQATDPFAVALRFFIL